MATRTPKSTTPVDASALSGDAAVATTTPSDDGRTQIKLKELVDRVVERSGSKKSEVKAITEAVLVEMGAALSTGEDLNLPGLGKVMVKKENSNENARIYTTKVRQPKSVA